MTNDKLQLIRSALATKLGHNKCPLCNNLALEVQSYFVPLPVNPDDARAVSLGGQIAPSAVLICSYCGNTLLINLIRLGIGPAFGFTL